MRKTKKESFFWTSYSDLMTSLFFIMLVLFILTIVLLHNRMVDIEKERKATQEQLDKIKEIEESVQKIDSTYFGYDEKHKRHTLKNIKVAFKTESSNIYDLPESTLIRLFDAGEAIKEFVDAAVFKNKDVKYLLIIEGQSSRDDYSYNYELSYARSLSLVKYWKEKQIHFNPNNCEIIIAGSGQESPFRIKPDTPPANQRFVIHIIPKIGEIKKKMK